jgi:hypothetical protein
MTMYRREAVTHCVIAGLDPAIHRSRGLLRVATLFDLPDVSMDHRVKPGGDEEGKP